MIRLLTSGTTPQRMITLVLFVALVLTGPIWFPLIGGYPGLDTKILIWALFALGFDILLGFTGYLSFGHAAFFGTSAYATGLTLLHLTTDVFAALAIGVASATLLSVLLGMITLRRSGIYFSILTLAFGEMLYRGALSILQEWTGGDNGLTGLDKATLFGEPMTDRTVYWFCAAILILGTLVAMRIAGSPFGMMLKAIKSNPTRLQYTGLDVQDYKLSAFVISAVYAGCAGSLMVIYEPYVATEYLHWSTSGQLVIMSVIGGVGTLFGPMFGAAFVLYFENVIAAVLREQWLLVLGVVFVAIVTFMPGGFVDGGRRIRALFRSRPPAPVGDAAPPRAAVRRESA
jgi:branched-chain amino acid transport system permease protein